MRNLYVKLIVPTVLICVVAAGGLAATYALTKDQIAVQDRLSQEKALKSALPDAKSFKELGAQTVDAVGKVTGDVKVAQVFEATDAGGAQIGWGMVIDSRGYAAMRVAVGVDRNGKVTGVTMVKQSETPGLGTKVVANLAYLGRFVGIGDPVKARKLDAVTGATKSSNGLRKAVQAALLAYQDVLSKGGAQ